MPEDPDRTTVVLVRDLIFLTRITTTAKALDAPVFVVRDPSSLSGRAGHMLLVDLNLPGAIEAASEWRAAHAGASVIGFVSHVDADTAARAKAAGIDRILARSRFVELLPELLKSTTDL